MIVQPRMAGSVAVYARIRSRLASDADSCEFREGRTRAGSVCPSRAHVGCPCLRRLILGSPSVGVRVDPSMVLKRRSDVEVIEHSIREKAARKDFFAARRGQGAGGKDEANQGQAGNGEESSACASAADDDCPAVSAPGGADRGVDVAGRQDHGGMAAECAVADAAQGVESHTGDSRAFPAVDASLSVETAIAYAASTQPKAMDLAALWGTCFDINGIPGFSQEERRCACLLFDLLFFLSREVPGASWEDFLAN